MRRDAETNYLRLLHAGRLAMQEAGGTASIEAICATAGVTRATFYRHFPDRAKLHIAVLDLELEEMAKALAVPDIAPLAFLRMLTDMTTIYDRYLLAMPELPEYAEAESNGDKIIAVIAPSLERAQALGLIRQDVTGYYVMVACRMARSDWRLDRQASQKDALEHRLSLILKGMAGT